MSSVSAKALNCFKGKFNCAQSVLCALSHKTGLDEDTSLKISTAFGGGMAKNQKVCGAVTGALMAISLQYGKGKTDSEDKKKETYRIANEFIATFKEKHGEIGCLELLGANMHTTEGQKKIEDEDLFHTKCEAFVMDAAEMTEKLI